MSASTAGIISGAVYVLRDNIDTDQILTAEYLKVNPSTPEGYAQLATLALPFIDEQSGKSKYPIIVAGKNFGCGSSREHAVVALGASGVKAVLAQSYARIFFRNCVSTGQVLPVATAERLCDKLQTGDEIAIDIEQQTITVLKNDRRVTSEPVGELANIVAAGGLFSYARATGRIK
jgi:3-isopropylmalate/(R)-2-methylmalate dehydratase small subunit